MPTLTYGDLKDFEICLNHETEIGSSDLVDQMLGGPVIECNSRFTLLDIYMALREPLR